MEKQREYNFPLPLIPPAKSLLGGSTVWVQPTCLPLLSKLIACLLKPTKSALWFNANLSMHGKVWLLLTRSDAKLPKSACHSLGSDMGVRHAETEKKKRKKTEAIRPWVVSWSTKSNSGVLEWARNTKERASAQRCSPKK